MNLGNPIMTELLEMMRSRYIYMKEKERAVSIVPIYNHGAEAGASIDHPHAQIFASGIVSNTVGKEMDGAEKYYGIYGACVFCDLIKHEKREKVRIVEENNDFLSATFYAARFPFETWIYPKRHESQFELTSKESMRNFAEILNATLGKLGKTLDNPPFNMYIHTLPTIQEDSASYHWHLEITPRVSNFGGFELGSDIVIDVMSPEEAADYLRGNKKDSREEVK
jgi:UDPglucose--hexose-1-phosphate uridylyltransferase